MTRPFCSDVDEKRARDEDEGSSAAEGLTSSDGPMSEAQLEHRLKQRIKQIDLGKKTIGYEVYSAAVPRSSRQRGNERHPNTPDPKENISKRQFDGKIKAWRRRLHFYTPADGTKPSGAQEALQTSSGFYDVENSPEPAPTAVTARPLPPVVQVHVEPMQLGNGENSLLGQWAANSNSASRAAPMELAGDSCVPGGPAASKQEDLVFIPFQWGDADE